MAGGAYRHCNEEEAEEETLKMLDVYRDYVENDLAIPVITGRKTERSLPVRCGRTPLKH